MPTKTWNFTLDGQPHTLTLKHSVLSGKRDIVLDGQLLEHIPGKPFASGSRHEYHLGSHSLIVVIQETFAWFAYDLLVDGTSLTTSKRGAQRVMNPARQGTLMLGAVIVIIGLILSWIMKANYDRQLAVQDWPEVNGTITGLEAIYHIDRREDEPDSEYYHLRLDIEYTAADSRHRVRLEDEMYSYNTAPQALAAHSVGGSQRLYVNPADPTDAVLYFEKLSPTGWIGTSLGIMGMFLGVALLMFIAVWVQTRARKPVAQTDAGLWPDQEQDVAAAIVTADAWLKLPVRLEPILRVRQLAGKIALLAFLSLFWIVPTVMITAARLPPGMVFFFIFYYAVASIITFPIVRGLVRGLRGRRQFLSGQAQATARILRRRVVEHAGEYGTSYSYHLQLEFNPTLAAVNTGSLQIEAAISRNLYESLANSESVEVTYASDDPRIFILEGE